MKEYDEPEKADDLTKIQDELKETKAVLHKTIESVLARGEKLDDLVAKSDQLSFASRGFYGGYTQFRRNRDGLANYFDSGIEEAELLLHNHVGRTRCSISVSMAQWRFRPFTRPLYTDGHNRRLFNEDAL